ncbi:histidine kinase [Actinoallomurus purpureus]|uniref:sensor histidine kinase n=1 Tax=Actinoallomurus purpureus TaxID=478114 RepID=UPI00209274D6|nr:histidine kinase [Actinoallomurus purpureus]MCO6004859.1 histidine kinase [Actinoallomurus purpureus]
MTSDKPDFLHEAGPAAWRLAAQVVTAVGQVLLWILTGIGRLLRPITSRLVTALYGRSTPPAAPPPYGGPPPYASPDGTLLQRQPPNPAGPPAPAARPPKTPPLLRWVHAWRRFGESWAYGPVTGAIIAVAALIELPLHHLRVVSLPGVFALAATLPLMFRRESLRPASAIVLGALAASLLSGQQVLLITAFAGLYTLYILAQQLPRQSTGVLGVCSVVAVGVVYLASSSLDDIPWLAGLTAVIAAIGLGDARRTVETAEASVDEERERSSETLTQLNAAQREQAILRERARIARELHDVVAHSVSMIAVQAETAPYTMRELSPEAKKGFGEIAGAAREALEEMRRLLTVLRAEPGVEPEVTPQPRLDRLGELIDSHRGAGGDARLTVRGSARPLSTTIELSAYRIVQEALTNARRHAPGARVDVELEYQGDRLAVRVVDSGATAPPAAPDPATRTRLMGHGLVGMRERATMLGGRFAAGPRPEGGFAVQADLPVGQNRRS